jgi:hypothetical protein
VKDVSETSNVQLGMRKALPYLAGDVGKGRFS